MPTSQQTDANRHNAQHSTGPRTEDGKARSSMNALKTGLHARSILLPGEDPSELEALISEYHQHHRPPTPERRALCDKLARGEWVGRRLSKIEVQLFEYEISMISRPQAECLLGQAYARCSSDLSRLQRYITAHDREYLRNLQMLRLLESQDQVASEPNPLDCPLPADSAPPRTPACHSCDITRLWSARPKIRTWSAQTGRLSA